MDDATIRSALVFALTGSLLNHHYDLPGHSDELFEAMRRHPASLRMRFADDFVAQFPTLPSGAFYVVADIFSEIELPYPELLVRPRESVLGADSAWWRVIRHDHRTWRDPQSMIYVRKAADASAAGSGARAEFARLLQDIEASRLEREGEGITEDNDDARPSIVSRAEGVAAHLARTDADPIETWLALGFFLNREDNSMSAVLAHHLSNTPGWLEALPEEQRRILALALRFLQEIPKQASVIHGDRARVGGYQAAALLAASAQDDLGELSCSEWNYWLPILALANSETTELDPLSRILTVVMASCPGEVIPALISLLRNECRLDGAKAFIIALESRWNDQLSDALLGALDSGLSLRAVELTLATLLYHSHEEGIARAMTFVDWRDQDRERAMIAARSLLVHGDSVALTSLIEVLKQEPDFARETLQALAVSLDAPAFPAAQVSEELIADLYVLAADLFPPDEDPEIRSGAEVDRGPRQMAAELRNRLLWRLTERGTWAAVDQLQRIIDERPGLEEPQMRWHAAIQFTLQATWLPFPDPREVLQVVDDERRRILRNEQQLLILLNESLCRLQHELKQQEAAADLWSEWVLGRKIRLRPKREESISDYLKRFLDRDLAQFAIATNREVENMPGSKTDLLVQYSRSSGATAGSSRLSVVTEVKAAWHDDVRTAIDKQLANRYLKDTEVTHGLYLVLWFNGDRWDSDDSRSKKAARRNLESLRTELTSKAETLSDEHRKVAVTLLDVSLPPVPPKVVLSKRAAM